jgi:uncharacterized protein (TIGR02118 family)
VSREEAKVIKALRAFERAPGTDHDEFLRRWDEHAALVLAVPGVRGYVQSPRAGRPEQSSAPFDGFSALWFDDEEAFARASASVEGQAAQADSETFIDPASLRTMTAVELVQRDLPVAPEAVKLVFFFRRRVGLAPEVFRPHWTQVHAPLVMEYITGLRRFVQNYAADSCYAGGAEPDLDGLAECYMDDLDALDETEETPEHDLVRSDEPNFVDVNTVMYMVATERVHLAPKLAP